MTGKEALSQDILKVWPKTNHYESGKWAGRTLVAARPFHVSTIMRQPQYPVSLLDIEVEGYYAPEKHIRLSGSIMTTTGEC